MTLEEIEARLDELYRISDWLTDHNPYEFLAYCHERGIELDHLRPGDPAEAAHERVSA